MGLNSQAIKKSITRLPDYPITRFSICVRSRDHDRSAIGVQHAPGGGIDIVHRDGVQQIGQPHVIVEAKPEELFGVQEVGDRGVGFKRSRDRANQVAARLVELLGREPVAPQERDKIEFLKNKRELKGEASNGPVRINEKQRVEDAYKCEVAAALPHSDELMALASSGIFALKYPNNPLTEGLKTLMARLLQ